MHSKEMGLPVYQPALATQPEITHRQQSTRKRQQQQRKRAEAAAGVAYVEQQTKSSHKCNGITFAAGEREREWESEAKRAAKLNNANGLVMSITDVHVPCHHSHSHSRSLALSALLSSEVNVKRLWRAQKGFARVLQVKSTGHGWERERARGS